jgi:hypothetical protein
VGDINGKILGRIVASRMTLRRPSHLQEMKL